MADKVILRNDTIENWNKYNPILSTGEIGIEIDGTNRYKIGDGIHHWNELPYPFINRGNKDERPILNKSDYGFMYYDNSISKPIWWTGTAWVDAMGNNVNEVSK